MYLKFQSYANKDLSDAHDFYFEQSPELAIRFYNDFSDSLKKIVENPRMYPVISSDVRKCLLSEFPYAIFYTLTKEYIIVIAVFHHKRNPKIWKSRKIK